MRFINKFRGDYHFLSNFAPFRITVHGVTYESVEAAFQGAKCLDPKDRKQFEGLSARNAQRLGRKVKLRPGWNDIRNIVMLWLLQQKFKDPTYREKLLATGGANLVEGNQWHDNYWGRCSCQKCNFKGKNRLGAMLMQVRSEIRKEELETEV